MAVDVATANLFMVNHIVVLMMENRSFDHMLGYLTGAGMPDVDGLTGQESNFDADGVGFPVFPFALDQTAFHRPGQPFDKSLDPCHSPDCVREQLASANGGFVRNFVSHKQPPADQRGLVMGHYTADHLPVYDFLARGYCVCDAWHSSIPGDTWPNRIYALTGKPAQPARLKLPLLQRLLALFGTPVPSNLPIYDNQAFTRHLADDQWRWYSHDPATLRAADPAYRDFRHPQADNFGYFNRLSVSAVTRALEEVAVEGDSFLDDCANDHLRPVSWVDPNFIDLGVLDPNSNDDHPPSDVLAGQALVLDVYDALAKSADWANTLLVITYDEHGGFYDHVVPPAVDDGSGYPTLGLRVPALVIGPRVRQFVCHQQFDHTTLIRSILMRFAANPGDALAAMGPRVQQAPHLGAVLGDAPRPTPPYDHLQGIIEAWRQRARAAHIPNQAGNTAAPDGAGQQVVLNDFQREFAHFATTLRGLLPPGHP